MSNDNTTNVVTFSISSERCPEGITAAKQLQDKLTIIRNILARHNGLKYAVGMLENYHEGDKVRFRTTVFIHKDFMLPTWDELYSEINAVCPCESFEI